jgi:predicted nuclease of restriction endonuclease-like (RecB) superfamily
MTNEVLPKDFSTAVKDIKLAILQARAKAAHLANAEALKLYFFVGGYISKKTRNAKWGSGAIDALSNQLQVELPGLRGFSASSIKRMRVFFEAWSKTFQIRRLPNIESAKSGNRQIASGGIRPTALGETELMPIRPMPLGEFGEDGFKSFLSLGFSFHSTILEKTQNENERLYYVTRAAKEVWSHSDLLSHLRADDYHHMGALPNNFGKTLSPMALAARAVRSFRDEYLLELVNLDNVDARADQDVDERILSKALVADVEKTIQALGGDDFCFMGREKRLLVEGEEVFIDLLFFHRGLQALVAVELKMGKFRPSYLGQLEFYLSALDSLVRKPNENPSIGLLLCEKMNKGVVEFAVRDKSKPLGIATYQTLRSIPKPYRALAPVIEGVRRVLAGSTAGNTRSRKKDKT